MSLISSIYSGPVHISSNGKSKAKAKKNRTGRNRMVQVNLLWDKTNSSGLKPKKNITKGCTIITCQGRVYPISVHQSGGECWVKLLGNRVMVHKLNRSSDKLYYVQGVNPDTAPKAYI